MIIKIDGKECSCEKGELDILIPTYAGEGNTSRRNYHPDDSVIGWYGGEAARVLPELRLLAPTIEVKNAETLTVTIGDPNTDTDTASA